MSPGGSGWLFKLSLRGDRGHIVASALQSTQLVEMCTYDAVSTNRQRIIDRICCCQLHDLMRTNRINLQSASDSQLTLYTT